MEIKKLMNLRVKPSESGGYEIWLDESKLHHVESYKIESLPSGKTAELSIKMLVKYPAKTVEKIKNAPSDTVNAISDGVQKAVQSAIHGTDVKAEL